jgi:hypothetical protein
MPRCILSAVLLLTTQRELRGLFSCLHEAALSPAKWNDFVRLSAASLGASSSARVVHDPKGGANIITASAGISAEATDSYIRHYGQLDEWFLNSRDRIKTGWVGTGDELVDDSDLFGSEFYHDFLRHHGMFRQCGAVLGDSGAAVSTITFLRERKAKSFDHRQLGLLRVLVPEIQNAVRVHRVIAEARRETASLAEALDMLPTGVIKVDARG